MQPANSQSINVFAKFKVSIACIGLLFGISPAKQQQPSMITQYEVPGYLAQVLPSRALHPQMGPVSMNVYKELQYFTDYTRRAVGRHNYTLAKKCFCLADRLYANGDRIVRNAI